MNNQTYTIMLDIMGNEHKNGTTRQITVKSRFASISLAWKYFNTCVDVYRVIVVDDLTGEIIYTNDYDNGEWYAED